VYYQDGTGVKVTSDILLVGDKAFQLDKVHSAKTRGTFKFYDWYSLLFFGIGLVLICRFFAGALQVWLSEKEGGVLISVLLLLLFSVIFLVMEIRYVRKLLHRGYNLTLTYKGEKAQDSGALQDQHIELSITDKSVLFSRDKRYIGSIAMAINQTIADRIGNK
jgi:hypothetical protein